VPFNTPYFNYTFDDFNGVTIVSSPQITAVPEFKEALINLIQIATNHTKQLLWLTLPLNQAVYIPIATDLGFTFHNCLSDEITLTLSLKDNAYVPFIPTYTIGAGAIVLNKRNELLVIRERIATNMAYKLPGGHVELTEKISEAIVREVFEETGINAQFSSILGMTSKHPYRFGKSNMYFICKLEAHSESIDIQDTDEIIDAKWINIEEYIQDESHHVFNRQMVEQLHNKEGFKHFNASNKGESNPKLETFFSY